MTTEKAQTEVEMEETTEQTLEAQREVEMLEEQKVEEKAEVATPEPEQETDTIGTLPEAEQPPEPTVEVAPEVEEKLDKEKLTAEVKAKLLACSEDSDCIGALITKFESVGSKLGIPTSTLINQVFSLLKGEGTEIEG